MRKIQIKLIDVLVFLYIFSLAFIRIGVEVLRYTFSVPDVILIIIFIRYAIKRFNKFDIFPISKKFLIIYLIFLIGISLSFIGIKDIKAGIPELCAYIYGFVVILILSLYVRERDKKGLIVIFYSFFILLILIPIISFIRIIIPEATALLFRGSYKYIFFMRMPNQLSIFLIICFSVYLTGKKYLDKNKIHIKIFNIFIPLLFLITTMLTVSRIGLFLAIILTGYSYFILLKKRTRLKELIFTFVIVLIILGTFTLLVKNVNEMRLAFNRGTDFINNVVSFSLTKGDIREENFNDSINAFLQQPINGVGLGNIWKNYSRWEVHNSFLSILSETGLLGSIPFTILLVYILIYIIKHHRRFDYLVVYFCILFYGLLHHIMRQRWIWVFFIYILLHAYLYSKEIKEKQ